MVEVDLAIGVRIRKVVIIEAQLYNLVSVMSIGFLTLECHERIKVIIDKKKVDDLPPPG